MKVRVKEVNPLKQGLKLCRLQIHYRGSSQVVKEVNPLKQGLKQKGLPSSIDGSRWVKEVNPLKQGLKLL